MKKSLVLTLCVSFFLIFLSSFNHSLSQTEAAGGIIGFCGDPAACNYEPFDIGLSLGGIIGGGDFGCEYGEWYIPFGTDTGLPATQSCEPLEGYVLADQCCITNIIANDSFCINNNWDSTCQNAYNSCTGAAPDACNDPSACNFISNAYCGDNSSCVYEQWYIPETPDLGGAEPNFPAVMACSAPAGYILANQCCVLQRIEADNYCIETTWDTICNSNYEDCVDGSSVAITGCTNPAFCNFNPLACEDDGSCYGEKGCTYPDACNYDASVGCDDGSCTFPGCTDQSALNFDILAECTGFNECVYEQLTLDCPGDFNGDGSVTTSDLSGFLAAFGTTCFDVIPALD